MTATPSSITAAGPVDRAITAASFAAANLIYAAEADVEDPELQALLRDLAEQVQATVVRRAAEALEDEARRALRPTQLSKAQVREQLRARRSEVGRGA